MSAEPKAPSGSQKKNPNAWMEYAAILAKAGYTRQVQIALGKALPLVPAAMRSQFHCQSGRIYRLSWQLDHALASFSKALKDPQHKVHALTGLAECYERRSQLDKAAELLEGIPTQPDGSLVHARILRRLGRVEEAEKLLDTIPAQGPRIPESLTARVWHERYLLADQSGDYPLAWSHLEQCKQTIRQSWQGPQLAAMLAQRRHAMAVMLATLQQLQPETVERWISENAALGQPPLGFILGLPRSGTTLVEKLLSQQADIVTTDERDTLARTVFEPLSTRITTTADPQADAAHFLSTLDSLSPAFIKNGTKHYYQELDKQLPHKTAGRPVLDKNPGYSEAALLIARLCPGARIIYPHRDPRAVFSSIWALFPEQPSEISIFWLQQDTLAEWMNHTRQVWQHLRRLLPASLWTEVHYEDLVTRPQEEATRLSTFLGLPSNKPAKAGPQIERSPSYAEISQAPHQHSIEKWKHYATQLAPGLERLAEEE